MTLAGRKLNKYLIFILSFAAGIVGITIVAQSFSKELIWRKDFLEDYLTGRAILLGMDPYLPVYRLAELQKYDLPHGTFLHPNPHSPLLALLSVPLGIFTYQAAAVLILLIEIVCLILAVIGIGKLADLQLKPSAIFLIVSASLGWGVVWEDLALGQTNLLILALLTGCLLALRSEKQIPAGLALGCVITLKIYFWPLTAALLIYRKTKALATTIAAAAALHLLSISVLGFGTVDYYYRHVGPTVAAYHRAHSCNMSFWSVGWKLFEGTGSPVLVAITLPPLIDAPRLAPLFSYGLVLLLFCMAVFLASRAGNVYAALAIMICFSLLMSPLCWNHYLVVTAIPLAFTAASLRNLPAFRKGTVVPLAACLLLLLSGPFLLDLEKYCLEIAPLAHPLVITGVSLLPMYGVVACAVLCYSLNNEGKRVMKRSMQEAAGKRGTDLRPSSS